MIPFKKRTTQTNRRYSRLPDKFYVMVRIQWLIIVPVRIAQGLGSTQYRSWYRDSISSINHCHNRPRRGTSFSPPDHGNHWPFLCATIATWLQLEKGLGRAQWVFFDPPLLPGTTFIRHPSVLSGQPWGREQEWPPFIPRSSRVGRPKDTGWAGRVKQLPSTRVMRQKQKNVTELRLLIPFLDLRVKEMGKQIFFWPQTWSFSSSKHQF